MIDERRLLQKTLDKLGDVVRFRLVEQGTKSAPILHLTKSRRYFRFRGQNNGPVRPLGVSHKVRSAFCQTGSDDLVGALGMSIPSTRRSS